MIKRIKRSKSLLTVCCLLSVVVIAACSSGGSGSSGNELLNSIKSQLRNYYFYISDGALKAIDYNNPTNPVIIEPASNNVSAYMKTPLAISLDGDFDNYYVSTGPVVYTRDSRLWIVDNNTSSLLAPRQLSTEDAMDSLCYMQLDSGINPAPYVSYTLKGPSNECHYPTNRTDTTNNNVSLPNLSDMFYRRVPLDANAVTVPTTDGPDNFGLGDGTIVFLDRSSPSNATTILGVLALDDSGNVVWFEGTDFSAPTHTVATGVTTLFAPAGSINNNSKYIVADDLLYNYSPGNTTFGPSLYTWTGAYYDYRWYASSINSGNYIYVKDGQRLLRLPTNVAGTPDVIADDPVLESLLFTFGETETHLFLVSNTDFINPVYSVDLMTGAIHNIATAFKDVFSGPQLSAMLINNHIYYSASLTEPLQILTLTGTEVRNFPETRIIGSLYSPLVENGKRQLTHLILDQAIDSTNSDIVALSTTTNTIVQTLGNYPTGTFRMSRSVEHYDGKFIFPIIEYGIQGPSEMEVYYADLNQENSIPQLTDDTTLETEVTASIYPVSLVATPAP